MNSLEKNHYIWLRRTIGITVMSFYPICLIFGLCFGDGRNPNLWWQTVSAQYYSNSKIFYIGALFAMGLFFFSYKGYDWKDRLVNILGGVFMWVNIAFPSGGVIEKIEEHTGLFDIPMNISHIVHCFSGIMIFLMFVINIGFLFTKHNDEMTENKKKRNKLYIACAIIITVMEFLGGLAIFTPEKIRLKLYWLPCVITLISFFAIGTAWLVKGEAIKSLNDE